jgi:hypothetical protein
MTPTEPPPETIAAGDELSARLRVFGVFRGWTTRFASSRFEIARLRRKSTEAQCSDEERRVPLARI